MQVLDTLVVGAFVVRAGNSLETHERPRAQRG
jgi:hypothetical protein